MAGLVTGFGPFLNVSENPSAWLAERSGLPFRVLDVSFKAVDAFVDQLQSEPLPDFLLMLGVATSADRMRLELVAKNWCGTTPDIDGIIAGPAPIQPQLPHQFSATLWTPEMSFLAPDRLTTSVDAGDYLCNYLFFQTLISLPKPRVGFLHVCNPEVLDLDQQLACLQGLTATSDLIHG